MSTQKSKDVAIIPMPPANVAVVDLVAQEAQAKIDAEHAQLVKELAELEAKEANEAAVKLAEEASLAQKVAAEAEAKLQEEAAAKVFLEETPVVVETIVVDTAVVPANTVADAVPSFSPTANLLLQNVSDYMIAMKPRTPINPDVGARHQVSLYRSLLNIINTIDENFVPVFTHLLKQFDDNKEGVFHEFHLFRFFEHIPLNETERKTFLALLNLIKVAAPVQGREIALRQVDFEGTLKSSSITEAGRQRILAFFNK